jgi:hypothetical protein
MAADRHDAPPHAGQVVRRVLLRRNIVIDLVIREDRRGRRAPAVTGVLS